MDRLPVYDLELEIAASLRQGRRLLIAAPTGSGKSTQIPQMLLGQFPDAGEVVVLQPRRLAARLLAARVASERQTRLGEEVGFQIRFENVTSDRTRLRFVTEGVLLRQMLRDPEMRGIGVLIFDEFHERHLYSDITLARALELQETRRPDLILIIMSATLDLDLLENYLHPCSRLVAHGRAFPVETQYTEKPVYLDKRPIWSQAAEAFGDYIRAGGEGDVLVFMPGAFEIAQTLDAVRQRPESRGFLLLPLHGELPPKEQDAAVARYAQPKVVVTTNVAETSLTIDGIRCVIDSGLARLPRYDSSRGVNILSIEKISRAAADQRAGRAGRTAPGRCLRLWSREEHAWRPAQELPEIKRLDLSEAALTLKAAGTPDLRKFRWLEPPEEQALARAEEMLADLGALAVVKPDLPGANPSPQALPCTITPLGRKMLAFPLHPRYARMLLAAQDYGCVYQACLVAALAQGRDLLLRNPDEAALRAREDLFGAHLASDFLAWSHAWEYAARNDFQLEACKRLGIDSRMARQVKRLLEQFLRMARVEGLDTTRRDAPDDALRKCILIGFSDRVAYRSDSGILRYDLVHGQRGTLARESVVRNAPLLVAADLREVEGKDKNMSLLLSLTTAIEEPWLNELFPDDLGRAPRVFYDATTRRVYAEERLEFRGLAISTRRVEPPPTGPAARLLAAEVIAGRLKLTHWDEDIEQWLLRLNLLARWWPELSLPSIAEADREHLIEEICHGAFNYKDIRDRAVAPVVKGWLNPAQQELLEKHAPERLKLSNGRTPRVLYDPANPPRVALRIQELYGVSATPQLAGGRVAVVVEILAPSRRPVQVTQDLERFWREHYPKVKQELQRKYPKHEWR
jgi:ATP-dependent helicase HrpB